MRFNFFLVVTLAAVFVLGAVFPPYEFAKAKNEEITGIYRVGEVENSPIKGNLKGGDYGSLKEEKYYSEEDFTLSYEELAKIAAVVYAKVKSPSADSKITRLSVRGSERTMSVEIKVESSINLRTLAAKLAGIKKNPLVVYVEYLITLGDGAEVRLESVRSDDVKVNDTLLKIACRMIFDNDKGKENLVELMSSVLNNLGKPTSFNDEGLTFVSRKS